MHPDTISYKLHEEDECEWDECGTCGELQPNCTCEDDEGTDEEFVETLLREAVEFAMDHEDFHGVHTVKTLSESSFLTRDRGLHIIMQDGSEWTIGIACYKRPRS